MKHPFQVAKNESQIAVILTRDSVCAGDDCDAPHEKTIRTHSFTDPVVLARETSSGYLPSVAGIGHSWICVLNKIQIAEITTTEIRPLVQEAKFGDSNRIHFIYRSATY
jgi:hypothetical protein